MSWKLRLPGWQSHRHESSTRIHSPRINDRQPTLNRPSGWLLSLSAALCMSGAVAMNVTLAPVASLGRIAEIVRNAVLFGPDDSRGPH